MSQPFALLEERLKDSDQILRASALDTNNNEDFIHERNIAKSIVFVTSLPIVIITFIVLIYDLNTILILIFIFIYSTYLYYICDQKFHVIISIQTFIKEKLTKFNIV